jgi:transposase-like protein
MNWKRKGRRFSNAQKGAIINLYREGLGCPDIAERAGCTANGVRRILKAANVYKDSRNGKKKQKAKAAPTKRKKSEENAYLKWALHGALRGWVDRLIKDIRDGRLD